MALDFDLAAERWKEGMRRLAAFTRRGGREFVTEQFRLLLEQIMAFTPPRNRAQGRKRVERDLGKVFSELPAAEVRSDSLQEIVRRGDHAAFDAYMRSARSKWRAVRFDPAGHARARDRRGRVNRTRPDIVLGAADTRALRRHLARKQGHVGIARAGWSPALRRVGGTIPDWVARHGGGHGTVIDGRDRPSPELTAINRTPWAARRDEGDRIVREAMKSRATRLASALRTQVRLAATQAGFSST